MPSTSDIKSQRDKFLAFSFASSDLLMEVDKNNKIHSALGAAKNLVGKSEDDLKSTKWLEIFTFRDKDYIAELIKNIKVGQRIGPIFVELLHNKKKTLFSAIKMPQSETLYVTIGLANDLANLIHDPSTDENSKTLLDKENFNEILNEKLLAAQKLDTETSLTFFDLNITNNYKERLGEDAWNQLNEQIAESLNKSSLGGDTAGKISESQYSLLHERTINPETLKEKILELSTLSDPSGEGLEIKQKTIEADINAMSPKEASRAVLYALNEFERKGVEFDGDNLSKSLNIYINSNAEKVKEFQGFIKSSNFNIYFQPIVNLETGELSHYETLSRFINGDTQEWIMFCEDVGLAAEFDIAVCDKVINYIKYKAGNTRTKFAINLSGQSIQDEAFFGLLQNLIKLVPNLHERLSFEITESHHIEDLRKVNFFLAQLRKQGFKIALDDFGAGAANFEYLQELAIDTVKIDGKYIRRIRDSQRDVAIVKSIANMCNDLGINIVAEYVEDEEQVKILRKLGVQYGQGFLYSSPRPSPDYIKEKTA